MSIKLKFEIFDNGNDGNDNIDSMKKDMNDLMNELSMPILVIDNFFKKLETYITKYDRLLYSEVTIFVVDIKKLKQDDVYGNLETNIEKCVDYSLKKYTESNDKIKKIIIKLWDHINLASNQWESFYQEESILKANLYPDLDEKMNTINLNNKNLTNVSEDLKKQVDKATDDYKNITTNMISIIALFVGISFVMFGGMSLMNSLFGNLQEGSIPLIELICLGALIGIIMVSVMYGFILFMLRITERIEGKKSLYRNTFLMTTLSLWIVLFITLALWYGKSC